MKKLFLVMLVLTSCNEANKLPIGILPENKMINLLIELHLTEAKVSIKNLPQDSSVKFYNYLQNKVFAENKVDSIIFSNSYNYYSTDSKKIDAIYTAVIDSLSLRESRKVLK